MRLVVLGLLLGCASARPARTTPPSDDVDMTFGSPQETCCAQCLAAADRDPAQIDESLQICASYPAVDDRCRAFSREKSLTAAKCR
jgi:hypothetical protein